MPRRRLRVHLPIIAYLAIFLATVAVLAVFVADAYRSSVTAAEREVIAGQFPLVRQTADSLTHYFSSLARNLHQLSLHESFTGGKIAEVTEDARRAYWTLRDEGVADIIYFDVSGRIVASAAGAPRRQCPVDEAFLNRLSVQVSGEPVLSRVLPGGGDSGACLLLGIPLFTLDAGEPGPDARRLGALVAVADWGWIVNHFLNPVDGMEHSGVFVMAADGTLLHPSPGSAATSHIPTGLAAQEAGPSLIDRLASGGEGTFTFTHRGHASLEPMMGVYTPMMYDGAQWAIGLTFPRQLVLGQARPVYRMILTMAAVVASFLVIGVALIAGVWRRSLLREEHLDRLEKERVLAREAEAARDELQVTVSQLRSTALDLEASKRDLQDANRELTRLDEMKSDFLSTVSHELRTPLAVIIGYLSILADGELEDAPEEKTKALQISLARARQLERLINDLLSLSRIERGVMGLDLSLCDPAAIITDLLGDYAAVIAEKKVEVRFLPSARPLSMEADEAKVAQVLSNLLDNAIKFSPEVSIIEISVAEEGDGVAVTVADRGVGVPESALDKLFDRFYQVDNSSKRKFGGAGIGLAVVKELTELHGGRVHAALRHGGGVAMTVVFPLVARPQTPIVTRPGGRNAGA